MTTETYPNVEEALRTFLRANAGLTALVGNRVFYDIPSDTAYPLIVISRIGGGDDESEACIDQAVMRFAVWGNHNARSATNAVVAALRSALRSIRGSTLIATGVRAYGATVDSVIFAPDPETNRPRFIVTARVTAIAV